MRRIVTFAIVILTILYQPPVTDAYLITFEGAGASIAFDQTTALRDEYAGVHFRGPGEKDGGAILKLNSTYLPFFGYNALVFNANASLKNNEGKPMGPETIIFDYLWTNVSIFVSPLGSGMDHFTLTAYDAGDNAVAVSETDTDNWALLTVHWTEGIKSIVLNKKNNVMFAADNLEMLNSVPEPGTVILLGCGLLGIGVFLMVRRRKQDKTSSK